MGQTCTSASDTKCGKCAPGYFPGSPNGEMDVCESCTPMEHCTKAFCTDKTDHICLESAVDEDAWYHSMAKASQGCEDAGCVSMATEIPGMPVALFEACAAPRDMKRRLGAEGLLSQL